MLQLISLRVLLVRFCIAPLAVVLPILIGNVRR